MSDAAKQEVERKDLRRLERLAAAGRLCSVVTHAVRNPLAGIRAMAESVADEAGEAGLGYALELIIEEVDRLEGLLAEFSVLYRGRPPQRRAVAAAELVEAARVRGGARLEERRVTAEIELAAPLWVDPDQLERALASLLVNAAEATSAGGELVVRVRPGAGQVVLEVADRGSGIAAYNLDRVLDPFFSTRPGNAGLGLAVCFLIVKAHGGRLELESEVGRGTAVKMFIPTIEQSDG